MRNWILVLVLLCSSGLAQAQWWGHPPARGRENVNGAVNVNPSVAVGLYYDTNIYRANKGQGDLALTITPSLGVVFQGAEVVANINGNYQFRKMLNLGQVPKAHNGLDIYANFGLGASVKVKPQSKASFEFRDQLSNISRAFDASQWTVTSNALLHQLDNVVEMGVRLKPGSALGIRPFVNYSLRRYTSAQGRGVGSSTTNLGLSHDIGGGLDVGWQFFPRTRLLLEFEIGRHLWGDVVDLSSNPGGLNIVQDPATYWKANFGLEGKFSDKVSARLLVGYGGAYFDTAGTAYKNVPKATRQTMSVVGAQGLNGTAQLVLQPVPTQRIAFGFTRKYEFTYFASYYLTNRPFLRYEGTMWQWMHLGVSGGVDIRQLHGAPDTASGIRNDVQVDAGVNIGADVAPWMTLALDYRLFAIVASDATASDQRFLDHMVGFTATVGF